MTIEYYVVNETDLILSNFQHFCCGFQFIFLKEENLNFVQKQAVQLSFCKKIPTIWSDFNKRMIRIEWIGRMQPSQTYFSRVNIDFGW